MHFFSPSSLKGKGTRIFLTGQCDNTRLESATLIPIEEEPEILPNIRGCAVTQEFDFPGQDRADPRNFLSQRFPAFSPRRRNDLLHPFQPHLIRRPAMERTGRGIDQTRSSSSKGMLSALAEMQAIQNFSPSSSKTLLPLPTSSATKMRSRINSASTLFGKIVCTTRS